MLSSPPPVSQDPAEDQRDFNQLLLSYSYDYKTGVIDIKFDYKSPKNTTMVDHEARHFKIVEKLLAGAGLLRSGLRVRIKRDTIITMYQVEQVGEHAWKWVEQERQDIALEREKHKSVPVSSHPIGITDNQKIRESDSGKTPG